MEQQITEAIELCPTSSHFVQYARDILTKSGFQELKETEKWTEIPQKFFVTRDDRQIIAINKKDLSKGFFVASIDDAPCFKAKPISKGQGANCVQVRIAPYGVFDYALEFDRDLKAAGRVLYEEDGKIKSKLFETKNAIAIIPALAIHMDRTAAFQMNYNAETTYNPILEIDNGEAQVSQEHSDCLLRAVSDASSVPVSSIIDIDLSFVSSEQATLTGIDKDLLYGPRVANLTGSIEALHALSTANDPSTGLICLVIYDSYEIGGNTRCGVNSNFLTSTLKRIGCGAEFFHNTLLYSVQPIDSSIKNKGSGRIGGGVCSEHSLDSSESLFVLSHNCSVTEGATFKNPLSDVISSQLSCRCNTIGIPFLSVQSPRQTAFTSDVNALNDFLKLFYNEYLN